MRNPFTTDVFLPEHYRARDSRINVFATPFLHSFQSWMDLLKDVCSTTGLQASPTSRVNQTSVSEYRLPRLNALQIAEYCQLHRLRPKDVPLGYFSLLAREAQFRALRDSGRSPWPTRTQVVENKIQRAHVLEPARPLLVHTMLAFHFKESDGHASFTITTTFVQAKRSAVINKTTFRFGTLGVNRDTPPAEPRKMTLRGVWRPRRETSNRVLDMCQERKASYPPSADSDGHRSPEREIDIGHTIGKTLSLAETRLGKPLRYAVHRFNDAILEGEKYAIYATSDMGELRVRDSCKVCLRMLAR